jgi:hypothetical protein
VTARRLDGMGRLGHRPVTAAPRTSAGAAARCPPCANSAYSRPRRGARPQFPVACILPPPAARRCRCGASVPGQPDQAVQRVAVYAERTAFRAAWLLDGVQGPRIAGRPGFRGPRLSLRWTGRGPAARFRTAGLTDCRPVQKRTERPVLCATQPLPKPEDHARPHSNVAPPKSARQPSPAGQDSQGTPSASCPPVRPSSRPGQPLDSWLPAGTGPLARPDHLTQQDVGVC